MLDKLNKAFQKDSVLNGFFFLFLGLILLNRIFLFLTVNTDCIDNDQVVMWAGAQDFSKGLFHVPRFYGQDYSTMMEAIFAVPFVLLGLPVYFATPISTHLIFLFPFLFTAFYLFKLKRKEHAVLVLAILLCMPVGYDIMNSIPRGFVTGLFFTSFFIINIINPKNLKFILLNVFMSYVGYLANPNSVLVSAPFLVFLFLNNYTNKSFYIYSIIGFVLALPVDYGLNHFYKNHPEHVLYGFSNEFSLNYFKDAITHLDNRFAHISPFIEETSVVIIVLFFGLAVLFYKNNKSILICYSVLLVIILISMFSGKAADGAVWSFYSYSRLYLGLPIFLYLFLIFIDLKKSVSILILTTLIFTIYKEATFKEKVIYHADEKKWDHLNLISLIDLKDYLNTLKNFCKDNGGEAIIIDHVWRDDFVNYAGPAIDTSYPTTFKPSFERRTWRIQEEKNMTYKTFMLYMADYHFDETIKKINPNINIQKLNDYGLFIIKDNNLTTHQFLASINYSIQIGN